MAGDAHGVLSAHFAAHLLADGTKMAMAPTLYSIDQLPRSHVETYAKTHKLALAALKGTAVKPSRKEAETAPFLADTRYLLVAVVAPAARRCSAGRRRRASSTSSPNAAPPWSNGARRPRRRSPACCPAAAWNCCCRKRITWPAAKRTS